MIFGHTRPVRPVRRVYRWGGPTRGIGHTTIARPSWRMRRTRPVWCVSDESIQRGEWTDDRHSLGGLTLGDIELGQASNDEQGRGTIDHGVFCLGVLNQMWLPAPNCNLSKVLCLLQQSSLFSSQLQSFYIPPGPPSVLQHCEFPAIRPTQRSCRTQSIYLP